MIKQIDSKRIDQKQLFVKKSTLPGAGKGLFTKIEIEKGKLVVEYKGTITTWKKIEDNKIFSAYAFFIHRNHIIDARRNYTALGRYANDARGLAKVGGIRNNAQYIVRNKKVYIQSIRNIAAGEEILVAYGKEYWDVIRYNHRIDAKNKIDSKKTAIR